MMFIDAWTKAAPEHWTRKKLKYIASLRSGESITTDSLKDEGDFPVYGGNGLRGYTAEYTHEGEFVLIGRQGALCGNVNYAKDRFWASEHAIVVTRLGRYDLVWLGELLRHLDLNRLSQSAAQPGISAEEVSRVLIAVPPLEEQVAIASYLKRETARIDALVAAKQRVLDLLAEKRKANIATAVTRGLDPNVVLHDSGVSWLEEIPAHWKSERLRWHFRERDQRGSPDLPLMEVSISKGVCVREFSNERIEATASDFNTYKVARKRDIAFNKMRMWQGAVGVAPTDGLVSPDYVVAEPIGYVLPDFAGLLFRIDEFSAECGRRSNGLTWDRLRIYWEEFREIEVPVPPLPEQAAIVAHVAVEAARVDAVRAATERTIDLLKERRSALIAAAVTGQLSVGAAP